MTSTPHTSAPDVLDDYLEQLLGDAVAAAPAAADDAAPHAAFDTAADSVAAAVATDAQAAPEAQREPTWDDLPAEVIYETGPADTTAAAPTAPADDDDALLQAAFDAAADSVAAAAAADAQSAPEVQREPTWDDVPAEVVYETGPADTPAAAPAAPAASAAACDGREPSWDDLPDEVIYETTAVESTTLTNADSPALEAAFSAAAQPAPPAAPAPAANAHAAAPRPPAPPLPPRAPAPAPTARAASAAPAQPTTWQELQAQAHRADETLHPHRRATERSSRWLRLRCGTQAYALELLKVQEVVLPVPLLPLRGTASAMLGIMNLRGQVVPVMDLGIHLGSGPAEEDGQTRIVVLEENGEIMGLRVSAVEDVTNLADSQIEPPDTARICRISNDIFRGVARLHRQPMILLDATRLLG